MKKKVGEYIMEELIGSGAYGEVYKGSSTKAPGEAFAIKMIPKKNMSEKVFRYLEREVEILQMLNHQNVVKLKDIRATDNHYYLIFEYCNGGDLSTFRKKKGGVVKEGTVRFVLKQIVDGLNAVYGKKAIHRDIKLSNVLLYYPNEEARVKERPIIKLGDFGFARLMTQVEGAERSISEEAEPMSFVGTPLNMAPELFHKKPYSFKADIWSLGTIVYELLCGQNCYTGINKEDLIHNIDKGTYKIPKVLKLSIECMDFLNGCLQLSPATRMKWKGVLNHVFVATDKYTPFNSEQFKTINKVVETSFEENDNYIFSSKIRYSFFPPYESSQEESKLVAGVKKMQIRDSDETTRTIPEAAESEEAEYIKVEKPSESPEPGTDFTIVTTTGKVNIEEDHFK